MLINLTNLTTTAFSLSIIFPIRPEVVIAQTLRVLQCRVLIPSAPPCLQQYMEQDEDSAVLGPSDQVDKNKEPRVREATSIPTWRSRHSPSCTDWS